MKKKRIGLILASIHSGSANQVCSSLIKEASLFDTSFYINEKYRYEKLHDIQYDEELGLYYILIKNKKRCLLNRLN